MKRTFVIIKPDAVAKGIVGEIITRYENAGLSIERMELLTIDGEFADRHYAEHLDKSFYPELREFMMSGPLVAAVLRGEDAVVKVRAINGATDPAKADEGTIRATYGASVQANCVHASDSDETAAKEIALWFS